MVPAWTVWPFSLIHQKGRRENAVQPCRSGSDFLSSLVWIPQHSAQDIWIHASYFSLERKVWGLQHMMYWEAEGVGFFSLEKRKQRAGCTITYGPGVEARPVFTKMHSEKVRSNRQKLNFSLKKDFFIRGWKSTGRVCWTYSKLNWIQPWETWSSPEAWSSVLNYRGPSEAPSNTVTLTLAAWLPRG